VVEAAVGALDASIRAGAETVLCAKSVSAYPVGVRINELGSHIQIESMNDRLAMGSLRSRHNAGRRPGECDHELRLGRRVEDISGNGIRTKW
jgi:hypothetical protein